MIKLKGLFLSSLLILGLIGSSTVKSEVDLRVLTLVVAAQAAFCYGFIAKTKKEDPSLLDEAIQAGCLMGMLYLLPITVDQGKDFMESFSDLVFEMKLKKYELSRMGWSL